MLLDIWSDATKRGISARAAHFPFDPPNITRADHTRRRIILDLLKSVMTGITVSKRGLARRVFMKRKSLTSGDNSFCTLPQADAERESVPDKVMVCEFTEDGIMIKTISIRNTGRIIFLFMVRRFFLKQQTAILAFVSP